VDQTRGDCQLLHSLQMDLRRKFHDPRSVTCTGSTHINLCVFYDDVKTQETRPGWSGFWCEIKVH